MPALKSNSYGTRSTGIFIPGNQYGEMRRLRIMQTELPNWKSKSSAE